MNKYHAIPTEVNGIRFASKREAKRYWELVQAHKSGEVLWFCRQPIFDLEGGIRYRPDFIVCWKDDGDPESYQKIHWTIEDVKGIRSRDYVMRKKMMRDRYGIEIVEI